MRARATTTVTTRRQSHYRDCRIVVEVIVPTRERARAGEDENEGKGESDGDGEVQRL